MAEGGVASANPLERCSFVLSQATRERFEALKPLLAAKTVLPAEQAGLRQQNLIACFEDTSSPRALPAP